MHFITLLRHGESEGNSAGVLQGQVDYPLTDKGFDQAQKLATEWKSLEAKFDLIISSPLKRASQTATIIADYLSVSMKYDPLWQERNFGRYQGSPLRELDQLSPPVDYFDPYKKIGETGESQLDLYTRAGQAIQNILQRPAGSYLVVSHGGILNKALYVIFGITPQGHYNSPIFQFGNTGYAHFRYDTFTRQWAVICLNCRNTNFLHDQVINWRQD